MEMRRVAEAAGKTSNVFSSLVSELPGSDVAHENVSDFHGAVGRGVLEEHTHMS